MEFDLDKILDSGEAKNPEDGAQQQVAPQPLDDNASATVSPQQLDNITDHNVTTTNIDEHFDAVADVTAATAQIDEVPAAAVSTNMPEEFSSVHADDNSVTSDPGNTPSELSGNVSHEISLPISLEVGTVNLQLDKISKLKPGDTVPFHEWPAKVKLRLNGSVVAEGYLVEINGLVGVKITSKNTVA